MDKTIHIIVTDERYNELEMLRKSRGYMSFSDAINDILRRSLLRSKTNTMKKKVSFEDMFSERSKQTKKIESVADG